MSDGSPEIHSKLNIGNKHLDEFPTAIHCLWGKLIFGATWLGLAFGLLAASWLFWGNDYTAFTDTVLYYVQKAAWKNYFQQHVFPIENFHLFQYLLVLGWLSLVVYGFVLHRKIKDWSAALCLFVDWLKKGIQQHFQRLKNRSKTEQLALASLFVLLALKGLFNIHNYDVQYDEAWTYNHFVSKGLLISMGSPNNNHIFYTILASLADWLPLSAKYTMRLPNYLGGLGLAMLFYAMLRSRFSYSATLIALAYFICSPPVNAYMFYARGYIWMLFFALLAFWTTLKLLKTPKDYNLWLSYIIVQCLGVYSNPIYLYHLLPLNALLLVVFLTSKDKFALKQWLKTNFWIAIILGTLHIPLLATNGLSFLTNSIAAKGAITLPVYWHYINRVADWWWWGQGVYLYWIVIVLTVFLLGVIVRFWQKNSSLRYAAILSLIYLLMPSVLYALLGTETPYRAWCFVIIYIAFTLALIVRFLELYITWTAPKFCISLALVASLTAYSAWQHYFVNWTAEIDLEAQKIAQKLQGLNAKEVYSFSRYNKPLLQFYYITEGKDLKVYMPFKQSKDHLDFNTRTFETVIWEKDSLVYIATAKENSILKQHQYQKQYENNQIILYQAPQK